MCFTVASDNHHQPSSPPLLLLAIGGTSCLGPPNHQGTNYSVFISFHFFLFISLFLFCDQSCFFSLCASFLFFFNVYRIFQQFLNFQFFFLKSILIFDLDFCQILVLTLTLCHLEHTLMHILVTKCKVCFCRIFIFYLLYTFFAICVFPNRYTTWVVVATIFFNFILSYLIYLFLQCFYFHQGPLQK